ncbi:MAG: TRZ/ATZ family hydrolase, partial [Pseudomonadales bacterium]|nr:TRZ/ATZ family hydrolase [Pseudomonadales bacterium]
MDLEPVDQIVHAGWVLPIEPPDVVLEQHCVVIERGRIESVMPSATAATRYRAEREWHLPDQLLMP